jgi:hypothetical protein
MKTTIIVIILFICNSQLFSQSNKICWNENRKLTWNDFIITKEKSAQNFSALSSCGMTIDFNLNVVTPYFNKDKSWVLFSKKLSLDLLEHEKLHFDIVELFARRMRREFEISDEKDLEKIYDCNMLMLDEFQDRYDSETDHGIINSEQNCWIEYVKDELRKLDNYKTTINHCEILKD